MLIDDVQQDGITNEMVEKLRSKKKAHRDQTEEDRWKEIYQILFPGEIVPSPCKLCSTKYPSSRAVPFTLIPLYQNSLNIGTS